MKQSAIRKALIRVPKEDIDVAILDRDLRVSNPAYLQAKRFSRWGTKLPKYLYFYSETNKYYLVPRNYLAYFTDFSTLGHSISGDITITLRTEQKPLISEFLLKNKEGITDFLFNVGVGKGKTVLSVWLINFYARKTLVVVPTKKLGVQWINAVNNFSNYSAGFIQDGIFDVTISTYQYLSGSQAKGFDKLKKEDFYEPFGHIVFDEYHNAGALKFHMITTQATCKYRTLLTATFRRKDGMAKVMKYDYQYKIELKNNDKGISVFPVYIKIDKSIDFDSYTKRAVPISRLKKIDEVKINGTIKAKYNSGIFLRNGEIISLKKTDKIYPKIGFSSVLFESYLAQDIKIIKQIANYIISLGDRNILVIGSRLSMLYKLLEILKDKKAGIITAEGNVEYKEYLKSIGKTKEEYREYIKSEAKIILGIQKIAKEGLDIPRLDTLVFVTAMSDIEQPLGRIERLEENKLAPEVHYFVYNQGNYIGIWKKAEKMFLSLGCQIEKGIELV